MFFPILPFSPCGRRWREAPDEGFSPQMSSRREPPTRLASRGTLSHKGEGALSKIDQPDPVGDERRLVLALDLDGDVGARLQFLRLAELGLHQHEAAAYALAGLDRREEAELVEAVVDAHGRALDDGHHLI